MWGHYRLFSHYCENIATHYVPLIAMTVSDTFRRKAAANTNISRIQVAITSTIAGIVSILLPVT